MDLKARSEEISNSFLKLRQNLVEQKKEVVKDIDQATTDLQKASAEGDHRENADYSKAIKDLQILSINARNLEVQLKELEFANEPEQYQPIGIVVMYSTVRLLVECEGKPSQELVYKVYPNSISDIASGILAKDSMLGTAIWMKTVGTVVTLNHRLTGDPIQYKILEIY